MFSHYLLQFWQNDKLFKWKPSWGRDHSLKWRCNQLKWVSPSPIKSATMCFVCVFASNKHHWSKPLNYYSLWSHYHYSTTDSPRHCPFDLAFTYWFRWLCTMNYLLQKAKEIDVDGNMWILKSDSRSDGHFWNKWAYLPDTHGGSLIRCGAAAPDESHINIRNWSVCLLCKFVNVSCKLLLEEDIHRRRRVG